MASPPSQPQHGFPVLRPLFFALAAIGVYSTWGWSRRWMLSGAPFLQFFILLGQYNGHHVLPTIHTWTTFTTLNLFYAICSTSWLFYWIFAALCYPLTFLVCLVQFELVSNFVRKNLRALLKELQFIDDRIAFFNIPALEIDTEVDGLMVLRGITFSLSTLSFVVHGVEVGIKLSDDMELAIQTEDVSVKLFRSINIGDCFANLKGGEYEMTFGRGAGKSKDADGNAVFVEGTPLLKAASREADTRLLVDSGSSTPYTPLETPPKAGGSDRDSQQNVKMTEEMTDGNIPKDTPVRESFKSVKTMSPDNEEASGRYTRTIDFIEATSSIQEARQYITGLNRAAIEKDEHSFDHDDLNGLRAAICSKIHGKPSVPHPPKKSIKVTTLRTLSPPYVRRFLHRLPMLLRLLLQPLSYFHPVNIRSITATASGQWIESMLVEKVFKEDAETDSDIKNLKKRIARWLADANFAVELAGIKGIAHVPFVTSFDITCLLAVDDVMAYRTVPDTATLKQVIRLGGADASFKIPSFLLPHHEHILPDPPSREKRKELEDKVEEADGKPKEMQAKLELKQAMKDETNVEMSVHARLPACFDQELLDFIAALVKATKIVEVEKDNKGVDEEIHGIKEFGRVLTGSVKKGVKKVVVDGVVNDRWIAKLVGKITKKLETARGEAGYSGGIPVQLGAYRNEEQLRREGAKLLP